MDLERIQVLTKELQTIEKKINKETNKYNDKIELLVLEKEEKIEELRNYMIK